VRDEQGHAREQARHRTPPWRVRTGSIATDSGQQHAASSGGLFGERSRRELL
jgi:hypothetical protein